MYSSYYSNNKGKWSIVHLLKVSIPLSRVILFEYKKKGVYSYNIGVSIPLSRVILFESDWKDQQTLSSFKRFNPLKSGHIVRITTPIEELMNIFDKVSIPLSRVILFELDVHQKGGGKPVVSIPLSRVILFE